METKAGTRDKGQRPGGRCVSHSTWQRLQQIQRASWVAKEGSGAWPRHGSRPGPWATGKGLCLGRGWPVGSWQVPGGNQSGELSMGRCRDGLVG